MYYFVIVVWVDLVQPVAAAAVPKGHQIYYSYETTEGMHRIYYYFFGVLD
jgi:hypothetical protein